MVPAHRSSTAAGGSRRKKLPFEFDPNLRNDEPLRSSYTRDFNVQSISYPEEPL